MDDQASGGTGRRQDDQTGRDQAREADQDYVWEGKPGEDFGPLPPPGPLPDARERRQPSRPDPDLGTSRPGTARPRSSGRGAEDDYRLRADGVFTQPVRRRRWGPVLAAVAVLVLLVGLTAGLLLAIVRPALLNVIPGLSSATPALAPTPVATVATPPAAASPAAAKPVAATSPTPLTIGAPSPPPAPIRPAASSPTVRPSPAILPTPPSLVTPPGLRFPTSTPARIGSPQTGVRTPPPIPPPRLANVLTRVWSEQVIHKVGDDASICGQTSDGSSAQIIVIAPDRTPRTLGEFPSPAERVCYTLKVDQPDLWVLTLIIRDVNANEVDRQSAALWVSR